MCLHDIFSIGACLLKSFLYKTNAVLMEFHFLVDTVCPSSNCDMEVARLQIADVDDFMLSKEASITVTIIQMIPALY